MRGAATNNGDWPPVDGRRFIRSDEFGRMLVDSAAQLADRYPRMDFSDAVAHVFAWFDRKLARNRRFINRRRFPTAAAFRAYLRQAVWNAGRLAERQRQRREAIEALPGTQPIVARELSPESRARLLEAIERLDEPWKTVLWRVFFEEADLKLMAAAMDLTLDELVRLYEEALDRLQL